MELPALEIIEHFSIYAFMGPPGVLRSKSGATSLELMQKALVAGCPMLAAVGAPSSLAIELAQEFNITLIGFLRSSGYNITITRLPLFEFLNP